MSSNSHMDDNKSFLETAKDMCKMVAAILANLLFVIIFFEDIYIFYDALKLSHSS